MGRYGKLYEQRFRQNFLKDFDWLEFNCPNSTTTIYLRVRHQTEQKIK